MNKIPGGSRSPRPPAYLPVTGKPPGENTGSGTTTLFASDRFARSRREASAASSCPDDPRVLARPCRAGRGTSLTCNPNGHRPQSSEGIRAAGGVRSIA